MFTIYCYHRDIHSFPTRRSSDLVVVVAIRGDRIVVGAIAIDHDAPLPGNLGYKSREVELVAVAQMRCPFEYKDEGIHRFEDRKSTRLNSSHTVISYAVFCLKKKK